MPLWHFAVFPSVGVGHESLKSSLKSLTSSLSYVRLVSIKVSNLKSQVNDVKSRVFKIKSRSSPKPQFSSRWGQFWSLQDRVSGQVPNLKFQVIEFKSEVFKFDSQVKSHTSSLMSLKSSLESLISSLSSVRLSLRSSPIPQVCCIWSQVLSQDTSLRISDVSVAQVQVSSLRPNLWGILVFFRTGILPSSLHQTHQDCWRATTRNRKKKLKKYFTTDPHTGQINKHNSTASFILLMWMLMLDWY